MTIERAIPVPISESAAGSMRSIDELRQAYGECQALQTDGKVAVLRAMLPEVGRVIKEGLENEIIEAHLLRLDVAFDVSSTSIGQPDHAQDSKALRGFCKTSFDYLLKQSPKNTPRFIKVPLSKASSEGDPSIDRQFVQWGIISANRALKNPQIAEDQESLDFTRSTRARLVKKQEKLNEQLSKHKNTAV